MIQLTTEQKILDRLQQGNLETAEDVRALLHEDEEAVILLVLQLQQRIAELESNLPPESSAPSTPSGMIPPYQKEPAKKKRGKKPGAKPGHKGHRRAQPERIDRQEEHRLDRCPDCGSELQRCNGTHSIRSRIVEDIPQDLQCEVTEHILHRDYCPRCRKPVEPKVETVLPNASIGTRLLCLTAYWHYALGITMAQILDTLTFHLQFTQSKGGLIQQWNALRIILQVWYESLMREIQQSAVLHGDETGWRVNGKTYWLWCFTDANTTFYMVDRSRGSPAVKPLFQETFNGILVTDFWAAYDAVGWWKHQCCLLHLLRELKKVNQHNSSEEWQAFSKKTKRLIKDALRLRAREDFTPENCAPRIERLYVRLLDLATANYTDKDAKRLAKRLEKYRDELFTFLDHPEVPSDNNHAEREIRSAVIMRKVIYGNRSDEGALTQSVLMTVFRTLKRRGYNPITTLVSALREYIRTGKLPPFPPVISSNG